MTKEKLKAIKSDSQKARTTLNRFKKLLNNDKELMKYIPEDRDYYSFKRGMEMVVDELDYQLNKR